VRGGVSGPITDGIGFRVAGSFYDTDGFIPNTFLGEDADPYQDFALRGNLLQHGTLVVADLAQDGEHLRSVLIVRHHYRSSFRNGTRSAAGARALRETSAIATIVSTKGIIRNTW